jgi:hypothetical protein
MIKRFLATLGLLATMSSVASPASATDPYAGTLGTSGHYKYGCSAKIVNGACDMTGAKLRWHKGTSYQPIKVFIVSDVNYVDPTYQNNAVQYGIDALNAETNENWVLGNGITATVTESQASDFIWGSGSCTRCVFVEFATPGSTYNGNDTYVTLKTEDSHRFVGGWVGNGASLSPDTDLSGYTGTISSYIQDAMVEVNYTRALAWKAGGNVAYLGAMRDQIMRGYAQTMDLVDYTYSNGSYDNNERIAVDANGALPGGLWELGDLSGLQAASALS